MLRALFIILFLSFLFFWVQTVYAQPKLKDSTAVKLYVDSLNRAIDKAVVDKNTTFLKKHYADDFYFTHGTGQLDSKSSWINFVSQPTTNYLYRRHDSTAVEWHRDVAIVTGTLKVKRNETDAGYALHYMRVYALRKKVWQLLSHRTIKEWHY